MVLNYAQAPISRVTAANGIEYAYRETGEGGVPLVLLIHFRGNLDNWDPALVDALARDRRVIAFDNTGVGGSGGTTPATVAQMAQDAIAFVEALGLERIDVLGFSLGSFVAQEIALTRPALVRRLVLASSAPQGAPGMHGWAQWVIDSVGRRELDPAGMLDVFYTRSPESRKAGETALGRMFSRAEPDTPTTWQTRQAQYDAVVTWGIPDFSLLERVTAVQAPVFVANGDNDPMILPRYSHLLAGLIPGAELKIYPDAAHGFLFQHHEEFAADVVRFLDQAC
ncbi:alpha/beta fold hydrolase [Streptomyces sp. NPDC091217]|uniref:alpha/beta fold hydrolase n=1 Tax=Streptomyces sp. NPDC091217 TaxID=3365975 RepID=UPI0037F506FA